MTPAELNKWARAIAFKTCVGFLRDASVHQEDSGEVWLDPGEEAEYLGEEIGYLEARGLLVRHSQHTGCVRVLDESEAKA
jgi:hypothetical protein